MNKLIRFFLQGLLYLAPMAVTAYIIIMIFDFVDGILERFIYTVLGAHVPGLGLFILLVVVTLVGYLGQTIIARPIKVFLKKIIDSLPVLNLIYSALSDLFQAFV
jgi:uncharacterized membrane protein